MKRIDLLCASQASTAICSSMEQRSMVRHGMRPIDRRNPNLQDRRRSMPPVPCSSHLPISPKPYLEKSRKSTSSGSTTKQPSATSRKSSASKNDLTTTGSGRYLLGDTPFLDLLPEPESALVPYTQQTAKPKHESPDLRKSSSATHSRNQVVDLWVSLHCKGCEGKVRKHISKMEGVTSFSIDLASKKVTIIGNVTPVGVLTSVSKVKNAYFWPSSSSSTPMADLRY